MRKLLVVLALSIVAFVATRAGTERIDLNTRIKVDVISKNELTGMWESRKATFDAFSDARIIVCEEFKDIVMAQCLLITDDNEVILKAIRMLEEKI